LALRALSLVALTKPTSRPASVSTRRCQMLCARTRCQSARLRGRSPACSSRALRASRGGSPSVRSR
jgi:hypothetical protein